jgi:hypothetical protein
LEYACALFLETEVVEESGVCSEEGDTAEAGKGLRR